MASIAFRPGNISLPDGFQITEVPQRGGVRKTAAPNLGPLAAFAGTWSGNGFNTIFRPDNPQTPTALPVPIPASDNILELNLTQETLSFSQSLGAVPNRGTLQGDVFLNGIPYVQSINDVTTGQPTGIHFEPGLWLVVPSTTDPDEGSTVARMASIPHGTTVVAQGTSVTFDGAPVIAPVDITPFVIGNPTNKIVFASQTAATGGTPRIPQDLTSFISAGTITQAMLTDPNTVLRNAISGQTITQTTAISISTLPAAPLFGGGTENIAFLLGDPNTGAPNAKTVQMSATFWIETVEHIIDVPVFRLGQPPLIIAGNAGPGHPAPRFLVHPPVDIPAPIQIRVTSTQIQYTQTVLLNFSNLSWPHVSVATLVPDGPITIPPSAWT